MADNKSEKPIHAQVSAYLQRPLRTLTKAEEDNDAARHIISMSSRSAGPETRKWITKFPISRAGSRGAGEHGRNQTGRGENLAARSRALIKSLSI
jgi:hypothetical protein